MVSGEWCRQLARQGSNAMKIVSALLERWCSRLVDRGKPGTNSFASTYSLATRLPPAAGPPAAPIASAARPTRPCPLCSLPSTSLLPEAARFF